MKSAEELLTEWGKWVWQKTGVPRYVSPMLAIMRDNVPSTHAPDAHITDEEAETVSAIVARLKRGHPRASDCLHDYYVHGHTMQRIAHEMALNRHQVRELLIAGQWYVQAELDRRMAA
ncbi:MAG: antiterminator Q family protein [Gammaproteobacteria bacterium]